MKKLIASALLLSLVLTGCANSVSGKSPGTGEQADEDVKYDIGEFYIESDGKRIPLGMTIEEAEEIGFEYGGSKLGEDDRINTGKDYGKFGYFRWDVGNDKVCAVSISITNISDEPVHYKNCAITTLAFGTIGDGIGLAEEADYSGLSTIGNVCPGMSKQDVVNTLGERYKESLTWSKLGEDPNDVTMIYTYGLNNDFAHTSRDMAAELSIRLYKDEVVSFRIDLSYA